MAEETATVEEATETTGTESTEALENKTNETETTNAKEATEAKKETEESTEESLLGKEGEKETVERVVPEKYEFEAPEGMELDTQFLEQSTPILKELGLDQEQANKLFDLMVKKTESDSKRYMEVVDGWKNDTIKELGSDYQAKLAQTSKFIDKFGGKKADDIRQVLNDTGVGSHPAIVHLFLEASKHFGSDSFVTGENKSQPTDTEAAARKMFPNTKY